VAILLSIVMWFFIAVGAATSVYYGVLLMRVRRALRTLPTLRDGAAMAGPPTADGWPSVCVVVPAHNESAIVGTLVRSLLTQDYPGKLTFVFALDRCTDDTAGVIQSASGGDPRFQIVTIHDCPPEWAGKTHAVHQGVQQSEAARSADLVLFTDADTSFEPACIRAAVMLLHHRTLDMLSLLPTLTTHRWFERTAQPVAGAELIRRFPLDRVNRDLKSARFANGQFMLFRRASYERLGGHEAVKDALLEDLAFARKMRNEKFSMRGGVLMADGLLGCRMYPDAASFRRGWKRIFSEAEHRSTGALRHSSLHVSIIGGALPALCVIGVLVTIAVCLGTATLVNWRLTLDLLALLAWLVTMAGSIAFFLGVGQIYRSQRVPAMWVALYPIGAWTTASILREAAADIDAGRAIQWGGRSYATSATAAPAPDVAAKPDLPLADGTP